MINYTNRNKRIWKFIASKPQQNQLSDISIKMKKPIKFSPSRSLSKLEDDPFTMSKSRVKSYNYDIESTSQNQLMINRRSFGHKSPIVTQKISNNLNKTSKVQISILESLVQMIGQMKQSYERFRLEVFNQLKDYQLIIHEEVSKVYQIINSHRIQTQRPILTNQTQKIQLSFNKINGQVSNHEKIQHNVEKKNKKDCSSIHVPLNEIRKPLPSFNKLFELMQTMKQTLQKKILIVKSMS